MSNFNKTHLSRSLYWPRKMNKKMCETPEDIHHPGMISFDPYRVFCISTKYVQPNKNAFSVPIKPNFKSKHEKLTPPSPYSAPIPMYALVKIILDQWQELAHQYNFINPDKCTNHGSKTYTTAIMPNALVPIPLKTQLTCQGHKTGVSACPYGRSNNTSEKSLHDGLCAMPTNSKIGSLNASCTNPHAPPHLSLESLPSNLLNPKSNAEDLKLTT